MLAYISCKTLPKWRIKEEFATSFWIWSWTY